MFSELSRARVSKRLTCRMNNINSNSSVLGCWLKNQMIRKYVKKIDFSFLKSIGFRAIVDRAYYVFTMVYWRLLESRLMDWIVVSLECLAFTRRWHLFQMQISSETFYQIQAIYKPIAIRVFKRIFILFFMSYMS